MIEIKELNVILRGAYFQLEVVIEYDRIPGVIEQTKIPVKVDWDSDTPSEEIDKLVAKIKSAIPELKNNILPKVEQLWNALVNRGLVLE